MKRMRATPKQVAAAVAIALLLSIGVIYANKATAAINVQCKSAGETHSWGFWPATQYLHDHVSWCYGLKPVVGKPNVYTRVITSISHTVTESVPEVGGICNGTGTKHWNLGGSLNSTNAIEWEDEADFVCPTNVPYVNVNRADKMIVWVNAEGQYCGPDYCPCSTNNTCK